MKYPKANITFFLDLPIVCSESELESKQINLHIGNKWNYWFIQPSEVPLKISSSTFPPILLQYYSFKYLRDLTRNLWIKKQAESRNTRRTKNHL